MGYAIGAYTSYHALPLIMMPFSVLFMITTAFLPESPQYLVQKNKMKVSEVFSLHIIEFSEFQGIILTIFEFTDTFIDANLHTTKLISRK